MARFRDSVEFGPTLDAAAERLGISTTAVEKDYWARTYFGASEGNELRPPDGFGASPAFDPENDISPRLRAAYEATMPELYFGADPLPTWDEICGRVAGQPDLL